MKTATIDLYTIYGTTNVQADIIYRGKLLKVFNNLNVADYAANRYGILRAAEVWAKLNGFTGYRLK